MTPVRGGSKVTDDFSGDDAIRLSEVWARVRGRLRAEAGEAAYSSWLKPLTLVSVKIGVVRMSVPTRFMRDWVLGNYKDMILNLWREESEAILDAEIVVQPPLPKRPAKAAIVPEKVADRPRADERREPAQPVAATAAAHSAKATGKSPAGAGAHGPNAEAPRIEGAAAHFDVSAPLDSRLTFDNFVVGKPNEFAYAAARRVAEAPAVPFNPLFLYGPSGLGKTHLMHAIAWEIRARDPKRRVIYLSAEKFMYEFVRAVRIKDTMAFKDLFRSIDVLMIDDLHCIAGREMTQEEFFHTFNALVDQNRQVVISADKSPSDLDGVEERMRSRLGWGLVADIHPTTYELRLGILQAKAERATVEIPPKVLEFLAHKITANVRELEGALIRIIAHAELIGRPVTLETTQEVLQDLLRSHDRKVTIDEIQKRVAEHFNIRVNDMHSARRARAVARPRQVAMYLAKQLTSRSLPEIGRKFGGRDHTTVMHAVKKVDELRHGDPGFAEDVELLRRMLET
jgi:chromosomal replication initiator protein